MKIRDIAVAILSILVGVSHAYGVVGCLTAEESLASRSDIVVVGTIESIDTVSLAPCPDSTPEPGRSYERTYPRCGDMLRIVVSAEVELQGSAPPTIYVLVPRGSYLALRCDDRPEPEEMAGLRAILFLEKSGDDYWSVDGPDGIYCGRSPIPATEIDHVRTVLVSVPRRKG